MEELAKRCDMADGPVVAYWMGQLLSDMTRVELENAFCHLALANERLRAENCQRSIDHIRDLAAAFKARAK